MQVAARRTLPTRRRWSRSPRAATTTIASPRSRSTAPSENHGPRFAGLPMGHEFTSLVLALLQVGGYPPKVEQAVLEQIRALDGDFEFEIYVSLTCHNCPDVVQALNLMAVQNPRIKTTMIEGGAVPGRGQGTPDHGRADRLPERHRVRPGPHEPGRNPGQDRHQRRRARSQEDRGQGAVRRADRRRRPGRRGGRGVRGAQGHPHRRGLRAFRRPGARHPGHRELHLDQGNRRAEVRAGARGARAHLRRRHHEPAARRGAGARRRA